MKWFLGILLILLAALLLESGLLAYAMYVLLALLVGSRSLARSWAAGLEAQRERQPSWPRSSTSGSVAWNGCLPSTSN